MRHDAIDFSQPGGKWRKCWFVVHIFWVRWTVPTLVVVGMSCVTSFRLCRWGTSSSHKFTWGVKRKMEITYGPIWFNVPEMLHRNESCYCEERNGNKKPHISPVSLNNFNTIWWGATLPVLRTCFKHFPSTRRHLEQLYSCNKPSKKETFVLVSWNNWNWCKMKKNLA